jgi:hypothetical protein
MSKHAPPLANFALYRAARRTISHGPHAPLVQDRQVHMESPPCRNLAHVGARNSDWVFFFGPTVSIFNFNGLVHCVSADRAPTYPAADRRKTKPLGREARVQLAITIRQRRGTGPNARREHEVSGLAAASRFIQDFGHCSFPRTASPSRSPRARQHLGQRVTADCPN